VVDAPAVLVQGQAKAPDEVITSMKGLEKYWRDIIFGRQPAGEANHSNAFMRWLMDWYYMRIVITVRPLRFLWWEHANFSQPAQVLEVANVA
jgi:hypothetical protein